MNIFARNCRWAIVEPVYEFESEEECAELLALLDELEDDSVVLRKRGKVKYGT